MCAIPTTKVTNLIRYIGLRPDFYRAVPQYRGRICEIRLIADLSGRITKGRADSYVPLHSVRNGESSFSFSIFILGGGETFALFIPVFGCALDTPARQNADGFAFTPAYSYLRAPNNSSGMEDRLENYLRFIREVERLKSVERTAWTSSGRRESTAEHSWRLALLAMVLCGEYPRLDRLRVLQLALVHDLGETYDGDIPAVAQGDPAAKERVERAAVERLAGCLPEGTGRELRGVWEEYEACRTPEAKLVKALDKAETILQHNQGQNPSGFDYGFNLGYGAEWFRADEMLQRLRGLLDADTLRHLEK